MTDKNEKSLVKFFENIWYHYKWTIIIGAAALVMLIAGLAQLASKKQPDVFIYHVSKSGITANSIDKLTDSLSAFAVDYNGDGIVNVDYKEEIYVPGVISTAQGQLSVTDSFNLELFAGECVIYIMDEENERDMRRRYGLNKVRKLMTEVGEDRDVADPWYTRNFELTYDDIQRSCSAIAEKL